jgi:lipopolysaccharide/colanic/teichoic acid biosynthesis glycosyltransferase
MNTAQLLIAEETTVAAAEPLAPGLYLEALSVPPTARRCYAFCKRALDVAISALLLILLAPLFALIAIFVRLDSPGPALFIQKRVGRNGELFNIYKFRSMYAGAARYERSPTTSCDPRITPVGRLLRRTSLDELPQLLNVLLGNMSLVGPRPEMPFIVQHYNMQQRQRLCVTPGITGLWQLSPCRGLPIHQNIEYDLYYVRNRTFKMDVAILVQTVFFTMRRGI